MNQLNSDLTLPAELLDEIARLLPPTDIRSFSLVSQLARALTLPFIFGDLSYSGELTDKIRRINQGGREVKAVIKKLSLAESGEVNGDESVIFRFLESLPNLESFSYFRWRSNKVDCPSLGQLVASVRHCPLRQFKFWFSARDQGHPTFGPPKLRKLTVLSYAAETSMIAADDQYMHLYKLIQPSFTTLVDLHIHLYRHAGESVAFDLRLLRPLGATLQSFTYFPAIFDPTILDTIPELFPLLTTLDITLLVTRTAERSSRLVWKDAYDTSLAKNLHLQTLRIYADFRSCCTFNHWPRIHCLQCTDDRLKATRALAIACSKLEYCYWDTFFEAYKFKVIPESKLVARVMPVVDK